MTQLEIYWIMSIHCSTETVGYVLQLVRPE